jgi:hypothetical protein
MNERSPVGMGLSLTGSLQPTQGGQLTRGMFDGDVEIGGALRESSDALLMCVDGKIVGKTLGDRKLLSKEDRGQLRSDLAPRHRPDVAVFRADATMKIDPVGLSPNPLVTSACTSRNLLDAEAFFEPLPVGGYGDLGVIGVQHSRRPALLGLVGRRRAPAGADAERLGFHRCEDYIWSGPTGEIVCSGIGLKLDNVPDLYRFEVLVLGTPAAVIGKTGIADGLGIFEAEPVAFLKREIVDLATSVLVHPLRDRNSFCPKRQIW